MPDTQRPLTIVLHGLHQRPWIMQLLCHRLRQQGFDAHTIGYHSLTRSISHHSEAVNKWLTDFRQGTHTPTRTHQINDASDMPIHMVGHSLGGLVIRDFLWRYPEWQVRHCVTLGTPHLGSVTSQYIYRWIRPFVGHAYQGALDGSLRTDLPTGVKLGVIAGNKEDGLGKFFLAHHRRQHHDDERYVAHDGTVYVSETRLEAACDHIVLPVSHTGMLYDKVVANQTAYFLRHGHFEYSHFEYGHFE